MINSLWEKKYILCIWNNIRITYKYILKTEERKNEEKAKNIYY